MLEFIKPIFGIDFTKKQKAFYNDNNLTMGELFACVCQIKPDKADLTPKQWRQAIMALLYDAESIMCFEEISESNSVEPNRGQHRQRMTREEAFYIFGFNDITDGELSFMAELCNNNNLYRAISLLKARKTDCTKYSLSEKQWRRCLAMAIYEGASDIFCYGL